MSGIGSSTSSRSSSPYPSHIRLSKGVQAVLEKNIASPHRQAGGSSESASTVSASTSLRDEAKRQPSYKATGSGSSNSSRRSDSVSVAIPQEDIKLLQELWHINSDKTSKSILENSPDIRSSVAHLRELKGKKDSYFLWCVLSIFLLPVGPLIVKNNDIRGVEGMALWSASSFISIMLCFGLAYAAGTKSDEVKDAVYLLQRLKPEQLV